MFTTEVFGIRPYVSDYTYIDRGELDSRIQRLLRSHQHIAMRGASKCGKSWLRQVCMPDANIVACRIGTTVQDIYTEALANLGIRLVVEKTVDKTIGGHVEATGEAGLKLLAKITGTASVDAEYASQEKIRDLRIDLTNLNFIADTLRSSGRILVIEDFHYLAGDERKKMAFDLKALYDLECFVVIVGVWSNYNLLSNLNSDLTGRITEVSIAWSENDLGKVIDKGSGHLNITIDNQIKARLISDSYENVGLLQQLLLYFVDEACGIHNTQSCNIVLTDPAKYEEAAQRFAHQLDGLYYEFSKRVSAGIRNRRNSTGIYSYTMMVIFDTSDDELLNGLKRSDLFERAHKLQPRIQPGNLKQILGKLEELQIDEGGRNLILNYDETLDSVVIVDRQLLFYRRYHNMRWPWADLVSEEMDESVG